MLSSNLNAYQLIPNNFLNRELLNSAFSKLYALEKLSVAAALLHDVVEDHEPRVSLSDIRRDFGDTIAEIVDGVTKIRDISKSKEITRAESYRKLLLSLVNDVRVILIKFADRLHNMRTLDHLSPESRKSPLAL